MVAAVCLESCAPGRTHIQTCTHSNASPKLTWFWPQLIMCSWRALSQSSLPLSHGSIICERTGYLFVYPLGERGYQSLHTSYLAGWIFDPLVPIVWPRFGGGLVTRPSWPLPISRILLRRTVLCDRLHPPLFFMVTLASHLWRTISPCVFPVFWLSRRLSFYICLSHCGYSMHRKMYA